MSDERSRTPACRPWIRSAVVGAERAGIPTSSEELGRADARDPAKDRPSLTVLTGELAGRLIRLDESALVVGRSQDAGVQLADAALSRRHARFFRVEDQVYVEDLGSTNGTYVRGAKIGSSTPLRDGDHVQLGPNRILRFNLHDQGEEEAALELYESSVRDPTSGAHNRRYFMGRLEAEHALAQQLGIPLALLLVDIDQFKQVNDSHGHLIGDAVLHVLSASVQRMLKPEDTLARYGGDELVVLCRETSLQNALILAERIRTTVAQLPFTAGGNEFQVTVSIGVAGGRRDDADCGGLVQAADDAMYRAKSNGRNSIAGP